MISMKPFKDVKPCPFCEGDANIMESKPYGWFVYCANDDTCKTSPESRAISPDIDKAIAAWNYRPLEDAKDAEIERLNDIIDKLRDCPICNHHIKEIERG